MTFSHAEWELLSSANEDWYGLWEALASIRSALTDLEESDVMIVTQRALRSLLDKNLIYLCWFRHRDNNEEPLANRDAKALLADPMEAAGFE